MYVRTTRLTLLVAVASMPLAFVNTAGALTPSPQTPSATSVASTPATVQTSAAPRVSPTPSGTTAPAHAAVTRAASLRTVVSAPAVGWHVRGVAQTRFLGAPVGVENHWASAGGGWIQQFQHGWAAVSDAGFGGMVTGSQLGYFNAHGFVNGVGWPMGNSVTDAKGSYQRFGSRGNVISGALMSSSAGTYRLQGGMYASYFGQNLRGVLGSPTGEEQRWASGGGGWAQGFTGGWLLYKSMGTNGYIPSYFPWPNLNALGWPKGGPHSTCGGQGITFERGTLMRNGSVCGPTHPVTPPAKPAPVSGYVLSPGWNGVKVFLAQQALGLPYNPTTTTMGSMTESALKRFQARHGLVADGILGPLTFKALNTGYSFDVDAWKQPARVAANASRAARANAAATFARQQAGKIYIWGGTGPMGYDCAGLALQALRAGGFDPRYVSNYFDVYPASDLSDHMWRDTGEFRPTSSPAVGDMAFWGSGGTVHHMAMYLGNGQWIQAVNQGVVISNGGLAGAEAKSGWSHRAFFGYRSAIR